MLTTSPESQEKSPTELDDPQSLEHGHSSESSRRSPGAGQKEPLQRAYPTTIGFKEYWVKAPPKFEIPTLSGSKEIPTSPNFIGSSPYLPEPKIKPTRVLFGLIVVKEILHRQITTPLTKLLPQNQHGMHDTPTVWHQLTRGQPQKI